MIKGYALAARSIPYRQWQRVQLQVMYWQRGYLHVAVRHPFGKVMRSSCFQNCTVLRCLLCDRSGTSAPRYTRQTQEFQLEQLGAFHKTAIPDNCFKHGAASVYSYFFEKSPLLAPFNLMS